MSLLPADIGVLHGRVATVEAIRRSIVTAASEGRLRAWCPCRALRASARPLSPSTWVTSSPTSFPTASGTRDCAVGAESGSPVRRPVRAAHLLGRSPGGPTRHRRGWPGQPRFGRRSPVATSSSSWTMPPQQQVEPLLPGAGGCAVIVTSRSTLGALVALHGGRAVGLDPLSPDAAADLLVAVFRDHGFSVAPDVVHDLAALCGNLPLALRIAAANLATTGPEDARAYVRRLRDGDRLVASPCPATPEWRCAPRSHRPINGSAAPNGARCGLLGSTPTDCFTTEDLAALADVDWSTADAMLRTLTSSHLVRPRPGRSVRDPRPHPPVRSSGRPRGHRPSARRSPGSTVPRVPGHRRRAGTAQLPPDGVPAPTRRLGPAYGGGRAARDAELVPRRVRQSAQRDPARGAARPT